MHVRGWVGLKMNFKPNEIDGRSMVNCDGTSDVVGTLIAEISAIRDDLNRQNEQITSLQTELERKDERIDDLETEVQS